MTSFIEITDSDTNKKFIINANDIVNIAFRNTKITIVKAKSKCTPGHIHEYWVKESLDQLKLLIEKAL